MRVLTFCIFFIGSTIASFGQNYCDSLYYQLDPKFVSLNTQQLIINQVLECHYGYGASDSFSLFDRYYNGTNSLNTDEVKEVFIDVIEGYLEENDEVELGYILQGLSFSTERSPIYNYTNEVAGVVSDRNESDFLDAQIERLLGNTSDLHFINEIEYLPDSIASSIEDFAARKLAYLEVRDGANLFDVSLNRVDSLQHLFSNLNIALVDPNLSLSSIFNRHMNYYIYLLEDTIRTQSSSYLSASQFAFINNDTSFVQDIDEAGVIASKRYEDFRNNQMLEIATSLNQLTENTNLNLDDLQCIQNYLSTNIDVLDQLESDLNGSPDPISQLDTHTSKLRETIAMGGLVDAYLNGDLDLATLSNTFGNLECENGNTIAQTIDVINTRPDMTFVGKLLRYTETVSSDIEEGRFSAISAASAAAVLPVAMYFSNVMDKKEASKAAKKRFKRRSQIHKALRIPPPIPPKRPVKKGFRAFVGRNAGKMLKKLWPKGVKALAKGGIQGYLIELAAKEILNEAVTAPILAAIDGLRKEMNARFDAMDQKLDAIIELQIKSTTTIMDGLQANREFIQREFNGVNYQLVEILTNQNQIKSDLQNILTQDIQQCAANYEVINNINPIEHYEDLELIFTNSLTFPSCLQGLANALIDNVDCADLAFFRAYDSGVSEYALNEVENFKKLTALFQFLYGGDNLDKLYDATQALSVESDHTVDNQWDFLKLSKIEDSDLLIDPSIALDPNNYIDANGLVTIMDYFETFMPFYEVFVSSTNPNPLELEDYLALSPLAKALRIAFVQIYSDNLHCVAKMAKAQQALMSGSLVIDPMYRIIYTNAYQGSNIMYNGQSIDIKRFCTDILLNNSILATNFTTLASRYNFGSTPVLVRELLDNGDFSTGNVDFETDFAFETVFQQDGDFGIVDGASDFYFGFGSYADHTDDEAGKYAVFSSTASTSVMWRKYINLQEGNYTFSCYVGDAEDIDHGNYPEIVLIVNDTLISDTLFIDYYGEWIYHNIDFNISEDLDSVKLEIVNASTEIAGNDAMLDDISLKSNPNLIYNGNFSEGDTGFITDHTSTSSWSTSGEYAVMRNADAWWTTLMNPSQNFGAGGNLYMCDSEGSGDDLLWGQPVQIELGREYTFSALVAEGGTGSSKPIIEVGIYSDSLSSFTLLHTHPVTTNRNWEKIEFSFDASYWPGETSLYIYNTRLGNGANNPMLDNVRLERSNNHIYKDVSQDYWEVGSLITSLDPQMIENDRRWHDLDFTSINHTSLSEPTIFLNIEVPASLCNDGVPIVCSAKLPIPNQRILSTDKFIYTEAFAKLKPQVNRATNIHVNTHIPSFYPDDNQLKFVAKSILTNSSNN